MTIAGKLSAVTTQSLMRHERYTTTQRCIIMANQLNRSVEWLHVSDVQKAVNAR